MKQTLASFNQLYKDYHKDVFRFAFWLCGQADEAKDIRSETFLRLWTASRDLKAETVKGYLLTIARNVYLQKLRQGRIQVELDHELVDPAPVIDDVLHSKAELHQTVVALQSLPEIDRTVLLMKAYEGLSYREISQLLGLSVTALKVKAHRARLKLAKEVRRGSCS